MQVESKISDTRALDNSQAQQTTELRAGQGSKINEELNDQQAGLENSIQAMHQVPSNPVAEKQAAAPKKKNSVMTKILIGIGAFLAAVLGFKFFFGSKKSV